MKEKTETQQGTVYWITGLSGSGKTTIGKLLYEQLRAKKPNVVFLDGDELRYVFGDDLGHTLDDRKKSGMRNARICEYLAKQSCDVVCATISMFNECRDWNRKHLKKYREVYLRVPMEILKARDTKDIYAQAQRGELVNVYGVDLPVEEPLNPDLVIENDGSLTPALIVEQILNLREALV